MAVFKHMDRQEIEAIIKNFNIGTLQEYEPIVKGIDNSNFKITTNNGFFILTIFNPRLKTEDLPYYLDFMNHLKNKSIACPEVIKSHVGETVSLLDNYYRYSILSFMQGEEAKKIELQHIREAGKTLALMHKASEDFTQQKPNDMDLYNCGELVMSSLPLTKDFDTSLENTLIEEAKFLKSNIEKYQHLPKGNIHADFFPDNVFFNTENKISAVIDFYFSCYDFYVYDLMLAINAWCLEKHTDNNEEKIYAFLEEYQKTRTLSEEEKSALNFFGRVAAYRITASRIYDWFNTPKTALINTHNPLEYVRILKSYITQETNIKL